MNLRRGGSIHGRDRCGAVRHQSWRSDRPIAHLAHATTAGSRKVRGAGAIWSRGAHGRRLKRRVAGAVLHNGAHWRR